ncbi:NAD kinase [Zhongshania aliphaticivorans]|uniref:NAD kinase n=1 Tax=Zhongshania aliphaticivorans TaxID=1470434 RepID=A0A5S9NAG3_9GAMM|nr:NAD(+) kinase [Zhongshania aliphaticivorans]CAA0087125.1 NAD kinase [Zhongshania aliphaticivorans]CAA0114103.1 NAD kinase [Zhongshania aliphaticivorans]
MEQFRNIGVIGREGNGVAETLVRLVEFLQMRELGIVLDEAVSELLPEHNLRVSSRRMIGEVCDLIIVVGGDGSLLGAARMLARHSAPVLGVNRGRLGFLTDISPDEIEAQVGSVLDGHYRLEKRFLLDVEVTRDGEPVGRGDALNDVVLNSGTSGHMMQFELFIDGEFVYRQRSDGLIIATPTGSTAYALSAGGPIMHPRLDAIAIVPMFPHTLSSRPIVIDGKSEIKMVVGRNNVVRPPVTCDGQVKITSQPGDVIHVRKKPHKLRLVHPLDHSFYASCRDKLGWGTHIGKEDTDV